MEFEYRFKVKEFNVIDGDTVDTLLDLGLDVFTNERVRLWGIDAPEVRTKDLQEKEAGLAAAKFLEEQMQNASIIEIQSIVYRRGKYGRLLGNVICDGKNINVEMLIKNLVQPYTK